jgi:hypothetical protein
MLSHLELRHTIESGFLPTACKCTVHENNTLTVEVKLPNRNFAHVVADGVPVDVLNSSRAISEFIARLKRDLRVREAVSSEAPIGMLKSMRR